ncbi:MAG: TonB-dependent siderophore receptor [Caulobacteraceae bacterium]
MRASVSSNSAVRSKDVARHTVGAMGVCVAAIGVNAQAQAQTQTQTQTQIAAADPAKTDATSASVSEVVVTGVRPLQGEKLPDTLQDTPQSVNVISQKLIQEQGVTRLEDALKNVPGITLNAGEGAARGDTVNIRGFSAFNDFFLDGIRDAAVYNRDSFNLESIEVVKGPSAVLFGRGSTGGAINQVSKSPTLAPIDTVTADIGTNEEYRGAFDIDTPIGPGAAFRLNGMGESSEVADRDGVKNRRWGVAPSLAFGLGGPLTLTLAYLHQEENDTPDVGIPFVNGRPASVPRNADFGLTSDRNKDQVDIGTARLQYEVNPHLTISDTFRYANYWFDFESDAPNFGTTVPTATTPLSSILVGRDRPASQGTQTNLTNQLDLTARFDTGFITHRVVAEVELSRQTSDLGRFNNPFDSTNGWVPETPLLSPDPNEAHPNEPVTSQQDTTTYSQSVSLTDTIGVTRFLDIIAGVRYDRFAASYNQLTLTSGALLHLDHTDKLGSPRVAVVFKPLPTQSFYFQYGTSFDPSAEALTLTTKTADLGPVKSTNYEVGSKTTLLNGGLLLTGALFQTQVDNAQTNDPENPTVTVLNGNERVRGLELDATGHVTSKLEVTAGYTYLDGKTIESGTAAYVGKFIPNAARNAVNLWAEYRLTDAWEIGGGGNYLGRRFADSGNTASVPSYVVWNAMTSYRINNRLTMQVNGYNLFNKYYLDNIYYTSTSENHVIPGAGRTVKFTVRAAF